MCLAGHELHGGGGACSRPLLTVGPVLVDLDLCEVPPHAVLAPGSILHPNIGNLRLQQVR